MPIPHDDEADFPRWLLVTSRQLQAIQVGHSIPNNLVCITAFLLSSAECEHIDAPEVRVTHEGHIRLTWNVKDRGASVEVRPHVQLEITRWNDEEIISRELYQDRQISRVRDVITWLFPQANAVAMAELL